MVKAKEALDSTMKNHDLYETKNSKASRPQSSK